MGVRVLYTLPPNFNEINKAFQVRGKPVIFAYAGAIHNPARIDIPPQLYAHEAVHQARQGDDPVSWWRDYIASPDFRLQEEIPAHAAEYACVCETIRQEHARAKVLDQIAQRLASPLYGSLVSVTRAKRLILDGEGVAGAALSNG